MVTLKHNIELKYGLHSYGEFLHTVEPKIDLQTKYGSNCVKILRSLALNGTISTWKIGEFLTEDGTAKNVADAMVRRILKGRTDGKKPSPGLIDLEIVADEMRELRHFYKLTIYGMLYAIKICNFNEKELYTVASNHKEMFPLLFGKIDYLKKNKISLVPLKFMADGHEEKLRRSVSFVIYNELLSYLISYYSARSGMRESHFKMFVSLWFYSYLSVIFQSDNSIKKWINIIKRDPDISSNYNTIAIGALAFYREEISKVERVLEMFSN